MVVVTEQSTFKSSVLRHLNNEHTLRNLSHDTQYPNTLWKQVLLKICDHVARTWREWTADQGRKLTFRQPFQVLPQTRGMSHLQVIFLPITQQVGRWGWNKGLATKVLHFSLEPLLKRHMKCVSYFLPPGIAVWFLVGAQRRSPVWVLVWYILHILETEYRWSCPQRQHSRLHIIHLKFHIGIQVNTSLCYISCLRKFSGCEKQVFPGLVNYCCSIPEFLNGII